MVDLSIAIVNYNGAETVLTLLDNIYNDTHSVSFHVYVIDNASQDNSAQLIAAKYPQVELLRSPRNLGYGGGNNLVLPQLDSRYHLVVNPDVVIHGGVLSGLVDYLDFHPEVALVTPKVLHTDKTEQFLPKRQPTLRYMLGGRFAGCLKASQRIRAEYTRSDEVLTEPAEIDFCTGCFMMMRTKDFKALGGFDEAFFMYLEDADLSYRLQKKGKLIFHPGYTITHQWEKASAKDLRFLLIHLNSMRIFMRKMRNYRNGEL